MDRTWKRGWPKLPIRPEIYEQLRAIAEQQEVSITETLNAILRKTFPKQGEMTDAKSV